MLLIHQQLLTLFPVAVLRNNIRTVASTATPQLSYRKDHSSAVLLFTVSLDQFLNFKRFCWRQLIIIEQHLKVQREKSQQLSVFYKASFSKPFQGYREDKGGGNKNYFNRHGVDEYALLVDDAEESIYPTFRQF